MAKDQQSAEVAFAVDDSLQGKGLGTLLLERLALLAARNGFTRFWAVTHADNQGMRDVFQEMPMRSAVRSRKSAIDSPLDMAPAQHTTHESNRVAAETIREIAEQARKAAEESRLVAEASRRAAEHSQQTQAAVQKAILAFLEGLSRPRTESKS